MSAPWRPIFVVVTVIHDAFEVRELEGHPIDGSGTWAVNMRGPGCRSKLIEVVDEKHVYLTREDAEKRIRAILLEAR